MTADVSSLVNEWGVHYSDTQAWPLGFTCRTPMRAFISTDTCAEYRIGLEGVLGFAGVS